MFEPFHQHLGVPHVAQQPGVPPGFFPDSGHPVAIKQGPEGAQV
jgi:hypothetical protein